MKMNAVERPVERIGANQERSFSIKASGKAFRILSSGLYKDKVLAVVRELSCNAYDAHADCGKADVPFDVHLPNPLESFFSIRDYGKGLSRNAMETIYTTYFESTKTDSNEQIGGLGLGCKSPLAVVDSFSVISRHGGVRSTYTIFFDEKDTPSILLMSQEPSDEPTGLEVKVPVERNNYAEFRDKAQQVYAYFNPMPNVVGSAEFKVDVKTPLLEGNGFKVYESDYYNKAKAIMGVVGYPINASSVPELREVERAINLLDLSIHIEFAIGDLDVTASREELSFDPRTRANIVKRVREVIAELPSLIEHDVNACQTEIEVRRLYANLGKSGIRQCLPKGVITWQGKVIDSDRLCIDMKDYPSLSMTTYNRRTTRNGTVKVEAESQYTGAAGIPMHAATSKNIVMILDDLGGRTLSRIRNFYETLGHNTFLFTVTDITQKIDTPEIQNLLKVFEGSRVVIMSDLPKPVSVRKGGTGPVMMKKWPQYGNEWDATTVSEEDGGLYVRLYNSTVRAPNGSEFDRGDFQGLVKLAKRLGIIADNETIYGVPKSLAKGMEEALSDDNGDWQDFFEYLSEKVIPRKDELQAGIKKQRNWSKVSGIRSFDQKIIDRIAAKLPDDHSMKFFMKDFVEARKQADTVDIGDLYGMFNHLRIPTGEDEIKADGPDLAAEWDTIISKYPMIAHLMQLSHYYFADALLKDCLNYIADQDGK